MAHNENPNYAPLMDAYADLRCLIAEESCPEAVVAACRTLSRHQTKLFCSVPDGATGMRLEPSRFLGEIIAALRGSEWSRVLVLVLGIGSP